MVYAGGAVEVDPRGVLFSEGEVEVVEDIVIEVYG